MSVLKKKRKRGKKKEKQTDTTYIYDADVAYARNTRVRTEIRKKKKNTAEARSKKTSFESPSSDFLRKKILFFHITYFILPLHILLKPFFFFFSSSFALLVILRLLLFFFSFFFCFLWSQPAPSVQVCSSEDTFRKRHATLGPLAAVAAQPASGAPRAACRCGRSPSRCRSPGAPPCGRAARRAWPGSSSSSSCGSSSSSSCGSSSSSCFSNNNNNNNNNNSKYNYGSKCRSSTGSGR